MTATLDRPLSAELPRVSALEADDTLHQPPPAGDKQVHWLLLGIVVYAVFVYSYMSLRFAGQWSENDTVVLAGAIYSAQQADSITAADYRYTNGTAYVALSIFIGELTGLPQQTLQTYLMPLMTALGAGVVYVAYRALLGNAAIVALVATFFVFLQPDFIWVTWRGSHEKLTWLMVFMLLFALVRTFTLTGKALVSLPFMVVFYLSAVTLISSNVFFASSFIFAMVLSFIGAVVALHLRRAWLRRTTHTTGTTLHIKRLIYVTSVCLVFMYIFMFFVYPPTLSVLRGLDALGDQLSVIFLNVEQNVTAANLSGAREDFNPYAYVTDAWSNPQTYLLLTSFNWAVLGLSFLVWLVNIPRLLRIRNLQETDLPLLLLWLLYPAFAFQLGLSLFADRADTVGGNLQVRLFTPLMLMAVPMSAMGVYSALKWAKGRLKYALRALAVAATAWFVVVGVFKATNEPLLSSNWVFSTYAERVGVNWMYRHIPYTTFWGGFDLRLNQAADYADPARFLNEANARAGLRAYFLITELEVQRWQARRRPMPQFANENRVYDNGTAAVYHRRPATPYQR